MSSTQNTFLPCCLKSFDWDGTPTGHESTLSNNPAYITGTNPKASILFVHDALGWKFGNSRLLADHFAREANVTVYLPDFFGGEVLDKQAFLDGRFQELDMAGFGARNARSIREPEIFAAATALRAQGYTSIGAVGYCFGGWAVMRLGSQSNTPSLVDVIVCAHPSWVTKADIDDITVPVQFLVPEIDAPFSDEMKAYAFQKLVLEKKSVPFEYIHFPGMVHGCFTKGDEAVDGEREAMAKAKDEAVRFFKHWLKV